MIIKSVGSGLVQVLSGLYRFRSKIVGPNRIARIFLFRYGSGLVWFSPKKYSNTQKYLKIFKYSKHIFYLKSDPKT